jgi:hypothetical protein
VCVGPLALSAVCVVWAFFEVCELAFLQLCVYDVTTRTCGSDTCRYIDWVCAAQWPAACKHARSRDATVLRMARGACPLWVKALAGRCAHTKRRHTHKHTCRTHTRAITQTARAHADAVKYIAAHGYHEGNVAILTRIHQPRPAHLCACRVCLGYQTIRAQHLHGPIPASRC